MHAQLGLKFTDGYNWLSSDEECNRRILFGFISPGQPRFHKVGVRNVKDLADLTSHMQSLGFWTVSVSSISLVDMSHCILLPTHR